MDRRIAVAVLLFLSVLPVFILLSLPCPRVSSYDIWRHVGDCVRVEGQVITFRHFSKGCYMEFYDGGVVRAVEFEPCSGVPACVLGRVQVWKGEPEVVVLGRC